MDTTKIMTARDTGQPTDARVRAVATWSDTPDGTTFAWPQACVDNRRARVLARIRRFDIPCDPDTLVIRRVVR